MSPIPDKETKQPKQTLHCFNLVIFFSSVYREHKRKASQVSNPARFVAVFSLEPGLLVAGGLPEHQPHSTFMVIVFYRLIDFYILSKSGSYTTWFII